MFGNNQYWWAGLIALLFFIAVNIGVYFLRDKPRLCYQISYAIAAFLFFYKIGEYIYWQAVGEHLNVPLEFSALSYFLFSITVFFRIKKMEPFGVFCGVLTGVMYSVSFWIAPDNHVVGLLNPNPYFAVMAIVNHNLLYFGAVLLFARVRKYDFNTIWMLPLGVGIMIAYCWVMHLFTPYSERYGKPLFIQITDGSILTWLTKTETVSTGAMIGYLVVVVLLLIGFFFGFYLLNNKLAKNRAKRSVPEDYFPSSVKEIYR